MGAPNCLVDESIRGARESIGGDTAKAAFTILSGGRRRSRNEKTVIGPNHIGGETNRCAEVVGEDRDIRSRG